MVPDRSPLHLEPIFGPRAFGADTTCADIHPGRIDPETGERDGRLPGGTNCCCMVCHQSGRENHPALEETAAGRLRIKDWKPTDEDGNVTEDQWSRPAADGAAEPTKYEGPTAGPAAKSRPKMKQFERRDRDVVIPMNPDQLAKQVDVGRARLLA